MKTNRKLKTITVPRIHDIQRLYSVIDNSHMKSIIKALKIKYICINQPMPLSHILYVNDMQYHNFLLNGALNLTSTSKANYAYLSDFCLQQQHTRKDLKDLISNVYQTLPSKGKKCIHINISDYDISDYTLPEFYSMTTESSVVEYDLYPEDTLDLDIKVIGAPILQVDSKTSFDPIRSVLSENLVLSILDKQGIVLTIEVLSPVQRRMWTPSEILDIISELGYKPSCYNMSSDTDYNYFRKLGSKPFKPFEEAYVATDIVVE